MQSQLQTRRLALADSALHAEGIANGEIVGGVPDPQYWVLKSRPTCAFNDTEVNTFVFIVEYNGQDYYYRLKHDGDWWKLEWPD